MEGGSDRPHLSALGAVRRRAPSLGALRRRAAGLRSLRARAPHLQELGGRPSGPRGLGRAGGWLTGEAVALAWSTSDWIADRVVGLVRHGRHAVGSAGATRARRLRHRSRHPLPNLWEVHPEARSAHGRELGLRAVPLDEIAGTAVAGPAQRGGDFLPLPRFRSPNWRARWQRIRAAVDRLEVLPPVDLVKYDDRYWVTDGHNRVAAALYTGQVEIDAIVTALVPAGGTLGEAPASLAELAADSRAVRAAGSGRWIRAASPGAVDETTAMLDRRPEPAEDTDGR